MKTTQRNICLLCLHRHHMCWYGAVREWNDNTWLDWKEKHNCAQKTASLLIICLRKELTVQDRKWHSLAKTPRIWMVVNIPIWAHWDTGNVMYLILFLRVVGNGVVGRFIVNAMICMFYVIRSGVGAWGEDLECWYRERNMLTILYPKVPHQQSTLLVQDRDCCPGNSSYSCFSNLNLY